MARRRDFVVIILILIGLVLYSVAYQFFNPEEVGRLKVEIDGQVFYDDEFNETYDYSQFWGKKVFFREKLNSSEFASGNVKESVELVFADLEEVYQFLRDLGVPNVVVGFIRFMSNGTFEEVYMKIHNKPPKPTIQGLSKLFGDYQNGVFYEVYRWGGYYQGPGLETKKQYRLQEANHWIWSLEVGDYCQLDNPPFLSTLTRYPE